MHRNCDILLGGQRVEVKRKELTTDKRGCFLANWNQRILPWPRQIQPARVSDFSKAGMEKVGKDGQQA